MSSSDDKTVITHVEVAPAAPAETNPCVVLLHTAEEGFLPKRVPLERSPVKLGRDADAEVILNGESVSRRHARLELRSERWWIIDEGSKNGTLVNDQQVTAAQILNNGDLLKVGPNILKYLSGADAEARYHEEIYKLTILDVPTQSYNRRYFDEALDREVMRARRHQRPLAVVMIDIDHFKVVNDEFGHLAGDYVLRELSKLVQARIRRDEVFARYGGEEFSLLLAETTLEGAVGLADNVRARIAAQRFEFQGVHIPITASFGVAVLESTDATPRDLLARADEKLYEAKRSGRNRVCS